jgi:Raf kinase inhibitor-like YbhB/YbcL family protein
MKLRFAAVATVALLAAPVLLDSAAAAPSIARLKVTSADFGEGQMMPAKCAFMSGNLSPSISWSDVPAGARSIAILCDDPDAPRGNWVHWVIFNIPASAGGLSQGVPKAGNLADGSIQGVNDFKMTGYDGPAPPGGTHRYVFRVFALDSFLGLGAGCSKDDLVGAMAGHIVAEGRLVGIYRK